MVRAGNGNINCSALGKVDPETFSIPFNDAWQSSVPPSAITARERPLRSTVPYPTALVFGRCRKKPKALRTASPAVQIACYVIVYQTPQLRRQRNVQRSLAFWPWEEVQSFGMLDLIYIFPQSKARLFETVPRRFGIVFQEVRHEIRLLDRDI